MSSGPRSLLYSRVPRIYKGWLPTVLKVSTAQATRFGVFQVLKSSPYYGKDTPLKAAGAGAFAGATSVLLFQVSRKEDALEA